MGIAKADAGGRWGRGEGTLTRRAPRPPARPSCRTDGPVRHAAVQGRRPGPPPPTPDAASRGLRPAGYWGAPARRVPAGRPDGRAAGRAPPSCRTGAAAAGSHVPQPCRRAPSPRGGPARGAARRGEGRSLAAARRPEARDGDLLCGRELFQPAGQGGEARRLLPQVTGLRPPPPGPPPARPAGHAPARPGPARPGTAGKLRPRNPARGGRASVRRAWGPVPRVSQRRALCDLGPGRRLWAGRLGPRRPAPPLRGSRLPLAAPRSPAPHPSDPPAPTPRRLGDHPEAIPRPPGAHRTGTTTALSPTTPRPPCAPLIRAGTTSLQCVLETLLGQLSSCICCDFCALLIASEPALICAIGSVAEQTQVVPRGRTGAPTSSATGRVLAIAGRSGPAALRGVRGHPAWGRVRPAPPPPARRFLGPSWPLLAWSPRQGEGSAFSVPVPFLRASGVEPGKPPRGHFCCGLQGVSFWRLDWHVTCSFIGNSQ